MNDWRRHLPSVDGLLREPRVAELLKTSPRALVVSAVRASLESARTRRAGPPDDWAADIAARVDDTRRTGLRPVLNATGVVLHTNLGRAPLARAAIDAAVAAAAGYTNLEYDLSTGTRGHRSTHGRERLRRLTGEEDAFVVNNAAGALVLALATHADGRDVLISRGELIEIGGSFRIPDILASSGARLKEVGTTNRTRLDDYHRALDSSTGVILTVHRSNFEQRGFVASPEPAALAALAAEAGITYLYDVGSGLLADLSRWGLTSEPRVADGLAAGAGVVLFSGDKLLGGPQAGCMVGRRDLIGPCVKNPLARALRADKLTLAALDATLALYDDPESAVKAIPVLRMLTLEPEELARRAQRLASVCPPSLHPEVQPGESAVGGGSFPGATLPTTVVALDAGPLGPDGLALRLRVGEPPVVARVQGGRVLLDPRTLDEAADAIVGQALTQALAE